MPTTPIPPLASVAAVILSYNARASLPAVITAVERQSHPVARIIIVDNGSTDGTQNWCRKAYPGHILFLLRENLGVGAGHNLGWRAAIVDGMYEFVWALEHDSLPHPDCLRELVLAFRRLAGDSPIGVLRPVQTSHSNLEAATTYVLAERRLRPLTDAWTARHTSGLEFNGPLFPVQTFRLCGLLNEEFFVGHEDLEYAGRLERHGLRIVRVPSAIVSHDPTKRFRRVRLLGRTLLVPGADVARTYYFSRNALYLEKSTGHPVLAVTKCLIRLPLVLLYILLFRDHKAQRVAARLFAIRDALAGHLGAKDYAFLRPIDAPKERRRERLL
jgi:GT2 family glycosyltransferase